MRILKVIGTRLPLTGAPIFVNADINQPITSGDILTNDLIYEQFGENQFRLIKAPVVNFPKGFIPKAVFEEFCVPELIIN